MVKIILDSTYGLVKLTHTKNRATGKGRFFVYNSCVIIYLIKVYMENLSGAELRTRINIIKYKFLNGEIKFEEGFEQSKGLIDEVNRRGEQIANEYKKKHRPITFANICR